MKKMYSIHDRGMDIWGPPMFVDHPEQAMRICRRLVNPADPTTAHAYAVEPHMFDLYYLGDFDQHEGIFRLVDAQHLLNFTTLKESQNEAR